MLEHCLLNKKLDTELSVGGMNCPWIILVIQYYSLQSNKNTFTDSFGDNICFYPSRDYKHETTKWNNGHQSQRYPSTMKNLWNIDHYWRDFYPSMFRWQNH